jgi:hypothetical protein
MTVALAQLGLQAGQIDDCARRVPDENFHLQAERRTYVLHS